MSRHNVRKCMTTLSFEGGHFFGVVIFKRSALRGILAHPLYLPMACSPPWMPSEGASRTPCRLLGPHAVGTKNSAPKPRRCTRIYRELPTRAHLLHRVLRTIRPTHPTTCSDHAWIAFESLHAPPLVPTSPTERPPKHPGHTSNPSAHDYAVETCCLPRLWRATPASA